jgi:hypothetical protein
MSHNGTDDRSLQCSDFVRLSSYLHRAREGAGVHAHEPQLMAQFDRIFSVGD